MTLGEIEETDGTAGALGTARSDLVVVANRLPVDLTVAAVGTRTWAPSPGGLVSALEPVMAAGEGAWVGWTGETSSPPPDLTGASPLTLVGVPLDDRDKELYYDGFCNGTIWPLYHDAIETPRYERDWWRAYVSVNQRFAQQTAAVAAPGATVWVHDYQLQLVPRMLRALRPDLRIGFFLHIPFPPRELFMQLPWRQAIVEGLLGADLIGFQVPAAGQNFAHLAHRLVGAMGPPDALQWQGRTIRVAAFPISIDVDRYTELAELPEVERRTVELRRRLGSPRHLLLGVDRLDYTKGIDVRLQAFRELLAEGTLDAPDTVMVQVATPSREDAEGYSSLRERIERMVGEINGEFGHVGMPAVHYLHRNLPIKELVALYRAADVMLVTPFRDGMNLVAKEYVAARSDGGGVLLLSEFAGAARELTSALQVNPHDLDGVKSALRQAVTIDPYDARRRMRSMRQHIQEHDVHRWASSFLDALATAAPPA